MFDVRLNLPAKNFTVYQIAPLIIDDNVRARTNYNDVNCKWNDSKLNSEHTDLHKIHYQWDDSYKVIPPLFFLLLHSVLAGVVSETKNELYWIYCIDCLLAVTYQIVEHDFLVHTPVSKLQKFTSNVSITKSNCKMTN